MNKNINLVIKRSIIPLGIRIILLEVIFSLISLPLTYFLTNPNIPSAYEQALFSSRIYLWGVIQIIKLAILISIVAKWSTASYEIKNGNIKETKGVIKMKEESISCKSIENVKVNQGFLGRISNFGSVILYSPMLQKKFILKDIPNPKKIGDIISEKFAKTNKPSVIAAIK